MIVPGGCEADITPCVPGLVSRYQGVYPRAVGPNCWNLALVNSGILPGLRYTTEQEMSFYLHSPMCRKLQDQERRAGDIASIAKKSESQHQEIHAFIYISDDIAYSKNGSAGDDPFGLQPMKDILSLYGAPPNSLSFYRCDSLQGHWQRQPRPPARIVEIVREVSEFEIALQERAVFGAEIPFPEREKLLRAMGGLVEFLIANPAPRGPGVELALDLLVLRFESIVFQLNYSANEFLSVEVNARLMEIKRYRH